jgi:imidazolonepropionase-like amidohydrolase
VKRKEKMGMSKKTVLLFALLVLGTLLAVSAQAAEGNSCLIKAKKIYTISQGIIENGMILVEKGKIIQVGKNMPVPKGVPVLEAEVVIPGLIDAHTHVGVYSLPNVDENSDGNEMTNPITPRSRLDSLQLR